MSPICAGRRLIERRGHHRDDMRRQAGCASVWDGRRRGLKMTHAGLAVGSAEESRGAALQGAERTAATDVKVEAAPSG